MTPLVAWPLEAIWGSAIGFIGFMVLAVSAIGLASKTLSIPVYGAYMLYTYYAAAAGIELLETMAFVTHTLVVIAMAFKLWRLEGVGDI